MTRASAALCVTASLVLVWCVGVESVRGADESPAAAPAGAAAGGLKLELKLDKTKYAEGEPWTGLVTATNAGKAPVSIDSRDGAEVKLAAAPGGREPKLTRSIGTGGRNMGDREKAFATLKPGESGELARFDISADPGCTLGGHIGGKMMGWDIPAGEFKMSITYAKTPEAAKQQGMENAWTGTAQSNTVTVTVEERKVDAKAVAGLELRLDVRSCEAGKGEKQINGRARLVNVSKEPVLVDMRAPATMEVLNADGKAVQGQVLPIPLTLGGQQAVTLKPGEWVDVAKFFIMKGAMMVQANPTTAYGLPVGKYTVKAAFKGDETGEKAWKGQLQSNAETVNVETSNAAAGK
jgi:hypothetical protein